MSDKVKEQEKTEEAAIVSNELTQDQALSILVQAVKLATKRGAYELEETEVILKAIKIFTPSK